MAAVGGLLAWVGSFVAATGGVLMLVRAFQQGTKWGLISLIPLGIVVFAALHWDKAKQGLQITISGVLVAALGFLMGGQY